MIMMIMTAAGAVDMTRRLVLALDGRFQFSAGHRPLGQRCFADQEIDNLVLIQRGAELSCGHRILLEKLHRLRALLVRIA